MDEPEFQEIAVSYTITFDDLRDGNLELMFSSILQMFIVISSAVAIVAATLLYVFKILRFNLSDIFIFAYLLLLLILPLLRFIRSRLFWNSSEYLRDIHWHIDDKGIEVSTDISNANLKWFQVYRLIELRNYFIIYSIQ